MRGVGGVITTADLRHYNEEMAYASLPSAEEERAIMDAMLVDDLDAQIGWMFQSRHDEPEFREELRTAITSLRNARKRLAAYETKRERRGR